MRVTMRRGVVAALCMVAFVFGGLVFLVGMNFVPGEKQIDRTFGQIYPLADPRFANELGVLLGPAFLKGNSAQVLLNGDEIFPAMLSAIRSAEHSINFESYIYWSGQIGGEFAQALADAARRGVQTHLLLDWVGSGKLDDRLLQTMTDAGVQVEKFHPVHWSHLGHLNDRTHRKLLIVDGRVGFTGGVGIAQEWTGRAQDPDHWRDTHVRVEGPVVAQIQSVFLDNWIKVTGHVLHGAQYFPELPSQGGSAAQMFASSPSGGSDSMQLMYLFAITGATRSIDLSAAYFVPDGLTRRALVEAMQRGVRLRIIVPGKHIDSEIVRSASKAGWGPLLQAGALIAEYEPTMFHCKVMIVDDLLVSLGSTNFDNRSFRLNDEATLNILDPAFAVRQTAVFEADLKKSTPMSFVQWSNRPAREKFDERLASLIGSQL